MHYMALGIKHSQEAQNDLKYASQHACCTKHVNEREGCVSGC